ncbi:uncharacterized protein [Ciconia boyciana]|uniref:uncharacterized protein isoform X3 n=1 Tax=Ciconia boyciana TaxID=52775 RepID=UPI003BA10992
MTRSAPHQAANTPRPNAAVEGPRRPRPSAAAGRLHTRDEAPRTPGRSSGASAEEPNVTATRRKRQRAGKAPSSAAQAVPAAPRPATHRSRAAARRAWPRRSRLSSAYARGRHTRQAPAVPGPAAPEERLEPPAQRGAGARPAPPQKSRYRSAGPLEAAGGRAHHYPAHTSTSASPRHRSQAASAQAGKPPLATITDAPRWRTYQLLRALLSLRPPAHHTAPAPPSSSARAFLLGGARSSASHWQSALRAALQVSKCHWQDDITIPRGDHLAMVNNTLPVVSRAAISFGDPDGTLLLNFDGSKGSQDLQPAPGDSRGEPPIPGPKNSEQDPLEQEHTKTEGRNSCRSGGCSNTLGMGYWNSRYILADRT